MTCRITSWNVNGLRAAARKGMFDSLRAIRPDILLLQEVRAMPDQVAHLEHAFAEAMPQEGGGAPHIVYNPAAKPGYSGTAIVSRFPLRSVRSGIEGCATDTHQDPEGRVMHACAQTPEGPLDTVSVYLPSGSSGDHRQAEKDRWLPHFAMWAQQHRRRRTPVVLGGDFNIAHTERDIFHWRSNRQTSGFLPHERAWIGDLLDAGWSDLVREAHPDRDGPYTWWSQRGAAYEKDRGWRIDYLMGNRALSSRVSAAIVHRQQCGRVSDHCALSIDLKPA